MSNTTIIIGSSWPENDGYTDEGHSITLKVEEKQKTTLWDINLPSLRLFLEENVGDAIWKQLKLTDKEQTIEIHIDPDVSINMDKVLQFIKKYDKNQKFSDQHYRVFLKKLVQQNVSPILINYYIKNNNLKFHHFAPALIDALSQQKFDRVKDFLYLPNYVGTDLSALISCIPIQDCIIPNAEGISLLDCIFDLSPSIRPESLHFNLVFELLINIFNRHKTDTKPDLKKDSMHGQPTPLTSFIVSEGLNDVEKSQSAKLILLNKWDLNQLFKFHLLDSQNSTDYQGTLAHWLIQNKKYQLLSSLINLGLDITLTDTDGKLPSDYLTNDKIKNEFFPKEEKLSYCYETSYGKRFNYLVIKLAYQISETGKVEPILYKDKHLLKTVIACLKNQHKYLTAKILILSTKCDDEIISDKTLYNTFSTLILKEKSQKHIRSNNQLVDIETIIIKCCLKNNIKLLKFLLNEFETMSKISLSSIHINGIPFFEYLIKHAHNKLFKLFLPYFFTSHPHFYKKNTYFSEPFFLDNDKKQNELNFIKSFEADQPGFVFYHLISQKPDANVNAKINEYIQYLEKLNLSEHAINQYLFPVKLHLLYHGKKYELEELEKYDILTVKKNLQGFSNTHFLLREIIYKQLLNGVKEELPFDQILFTFIGKDQPEPPIFADFKLAIQFNVKGFLDFAKQKNQNFIKTFDSDGTTLFHLTVLANNIDFMQELLKNSQPFEIDSLSSENANGKTPLNLMIQHERWDMLKLCLEKVPKLAEKLNQVELRTKGFDMSLPGADKSDKIFKDEKKSDRAIPSVVQTSVPGIRFLPVVTTDTSEPKPESAFSTSQSGSSVISSVLTQNL